MHIEIRNGKETVGKLNIPDWNDLPVEERQEILVRLTSKRMDNIIPFQQWDSDNMIERPL